METLKKKLEQEKAVLLTSLQEIGQKNPGNPTDWEGRPANVDEEHADVNDTADNIEEYGSNMAVVSELEARLKDIDAALERIENSSYGVCRVCGERVEEDRLSANPAAETCKIHLND